MFRGFLAGAMLFNAMSGVAQPNPTPLSAPIEPGQAISRSTLLKAGAANGKIAFMSTRIASIPKIFTINADGTGITCLLCSGATDPSGTGSTDSRTGNRPSFSPDGKTIAFEGIGGIWLMDADGANSRFIAPGSHPGWSPDGTRLVFTRNISGSNNDIFIMNADGTGQTNITNDPGNDVFPSWGAVVPNHPQGRIVFRSARSGNSELYVIAPTSLAETFQSSAQINITSDLAFDSVAKWSPDGQKLVFVSNRQSTNNEIYTFDLQTFVVTRLTNDTFLDDTPTWSPDGTKIAYTSSRSGNNEIIVIDSSSGAVVTPPAAGNITNNAANDSSPSWQSTNPLFTVTYDGKLRDKVTGSDSGVVGDGTLDATFTVQFQAGNGTRIITGLALIDGTGNEWDTVAGNGKWVLGATYSIDGTLLNQANGTINSQLGTQGHLRLFASDTSPSAFTVGKTFTLLINFSDGTSSSQRFTIPPTPALTLVFDGKLRDRVGQRETPIANPDPDGNPDGTFTVLLPVSGQRITKLDICQKAVACTSADTAINRWDTTPNNGKWLIGFADTLDSPSLLNSPDGSIPAGLQFGSSFKLFISDIFPSPSVFVEGSPFTLTATFSDNTTASATTAIEVTPGVTLIPSATGPSTAAAQQTIRYTINVANQGSSIATGVKLISEPLPANVNYVSSSGTHVCTFGADRRVTCTVGTLANGATAGVDFINLSPQTPGSSFTFTVRASANEAATPNNASATTTIGATSANLSVTTSTPPASITVGGSIDYVFVVRNDGPSSATGVRLQVQFPTGTTLSALSGLSCSQSGTAIICNTGSLPAATTGSPGDPAIQVVSLTAKPAQVGNFTVTGSVSGNEADPVLGNNAFTLSTTVSAVQPKPAIQLIGLEVTQTVQDLKNSVPLIENKNTIVRAHVKSLSSDAPRVEGQLLGTRIGAGGTRTSLGPALAPSNTGKSIVPLAKPSRAVLDQSFWFELPESWRSGTVEFEFRGLGMALTCSEPDGTPDCKTTVTFNAVKPLSVKLIVGTFTDGGNVVHTATLADVLRAATEFIGRYPVNNFDGDTGSLTSAFNACQKGIFPSLRKELTTYRNGECASGTCKTYYQELLSNPDTATCIPNGGTLGQSDLPGNVSAVFAEAFFNLKKKDGTTQPFDVSETRTHEMGHTLGLKHTDTGQSESCGDARGFSIACTKLEGAGTLSITGDQFSADSAFGYDAYGSSPSQVVFPEPTPDFMGYTRPSWMSRSNYGYLYNVFKATVPGEPPPRELLKAAVAATQVVQIDGLVDVKGTSGQIDAVYVLQTPSNVTLPPTGAFAIRLEDNTGTALATYPFDPIRDADSSQGVFSFRLPFDPATRRIVLLYNGTVLSTRTASANAPVVTVSSPNGGETLTGTSATIAWTASDADGDALTYMVEYSRDNGATWRALAVNLTSTSLIVNPGMLPGSNQALVRVTASDGFNTAQDRSDATFTVPDHAPQPAISVPANNRLYIADQTIVFEGMAIDIEDGMIGSAQLSWTSSLNGPLGTGRSLSINAANLQEGTHTITLAAADSKSNLGNATVAIQVLRNRPVLPATLSVGPSAITFITGVGATITPAQPLSLSNSGDGDLNWSATADQPWIKLDAASGAAPATLNVSADATGKPAGQYTGVITITASGAAASPQSISVNLNVSAGLAVRVDIDGNNTYDALTDGLISLRYLFGLTGTPLVANALGSGATRQTPQDIITYLDGIRANLDIDSNGKSDALTDGLLLLRYLFGLRGQALINNAVAADATRKTAAEIEQYIGTLLP